MPVNLSKNWVLRYLQEQGISSEVFWWHPKMRSKLHRLGIPDEVSVPKLVGMLRHRKKEKNGFATGASRRRKEVRGTVRERAIWWHAVRHRIAEEGRDALAADVQFILELSHLMGKEPYYAARAHLAFDKDISKPERYLTRGRKETYIRTCSSEPYKGLLKFGCTDGFCASRYASDTKFGPGQPLLEIPGNCENHWLVILRRWKVSGNGSREVIRPEGLLESGILDLYADMSHGGAFACGSSKEKEEVKARAEGWLSWYRGQVSSCSLAT